MIWAYYYELLHYLVRLARAFINKYNKRSYTKLSILLSWLNFPVDLGLGLCSKTMYLSVRHTMSSLILIQCNQQAVYQGHPPELCVSALLIFISDFPTLKCDINLYVLVFINFISAYKRSNELLNQDFRTWA